MALAVPVLSHSPVNDCIGCNVPRGRGDYYRGDVQHAADDANLNSLSVQGHEDRGQESGVSSTKHATIYI